MLSFLFFILVLIRKYFIMKIILAAEPNTVDKIEKKIIDQEIENDLNEPVEKESTVNDLKNFFNTVENKLKAIRLNTKLLDCYQFSLRDREYFPDGNLVLKKLCYQFPIFYYDMLFLFKQLNEYLILQINKRNAPSTQYQIFFKEALDNFNLNLKNFIDNLRYEYSKTITIYKSIINNGITSEKACYGSPIISELLQEDSGSDEIIQLQNKFDKSNDILISAIKINKNNNLVNLVIDCYKHCLQLLFSNKKHTIILQTEKTKRFSNEQEIKNYIGESHQKKNFEESDKSIIISKFLHKNTDLSDKSITDLSSFGTSNYKQSYTNSDQLFLLINNNYFNYAIAFANYVSLTPYNIDENSTSFILNHPEIFKKIQNISIDQATEVLKSLSPMVMKVLNNPPLKSLENLPFDSFENYIKSISLINNFIIVGGAIFLTTFKKLRDGDIETISDEKLSTENIKTLVKLISSKINKTYKSTNQSISDKFFIDLFKICNKVLVKNNPRDEMALAILLTQCLKQPINFIKLYFKYCLCGKDINYLTKEFLPMLGLTTDLSKIIKEYSFEEVLLSDFFEKYQETKVQETKIDSFINNIPDYVIIMHSANIESFDSMKSLLVETNVKIDSQAKKNFLQFFSNENLNPFNKYGEETLKSKFKILNIDPIQFKNQSDYYQNLFNNKQIVSSNDEKFVKFFKTCNLITSMESYQEYFELKKPKNEKLFDLNFKTKDYSFRVFDDTSIEYFSVGIETSCCQVLGSEGNNAVVDSFINPLAGVVVLEDKDGKLLAQSYFHYVPQDNGFILDNVEHNENNLIKSKLDINQCYAELGKYLQEKYKIKYFRCGLKYNKLDSKRFTYGSDKEDNRHFEYDEYSDYNHEKFLNLLGTKTKKQIKKKTKKEIVNRAPEAQRKVDERNNFLEYKKNKNQSPFTQKLPLKSVSSSIFLKMFQKYGI
mgnify:FL=1